jgi:hypothetical protein
MSNQGKLTKQVLRDGLQGKGPCDKVKAGDRLQYLWKDPKDLKSSDPLHDTLALMTHSQNDLILNYICSEFNGVFLKNIEAEESKKTLFQDTSTIFSEAADILRVLSDAGSDGTITVEEGDKIRKEVDDFNRVIFGLLSAIEKGKR